MRVSLETCTRLSVANRQLAFKAREDRPASPGGRLRKHDQICPCLPPEFRAIHESPPQVLPLARETVQLLPKHGSGNRPPSQAVGRNAPSRTLRLVAVREGWF